MRMLSSWGHPTVLGRCQVRRVQPGGEARRSQRRAAQLHPGVARPQDEGEGPGAVLGFSVFASTRIVQNEFPGFKQCPLLTRVSIMASGSGKSEGEDGARGAMGQARDPSERTSQGAEGVETVSSPPMQCDVTQLTMLTYVWLAAM